MHAVMSEPRTRVLVAGGGVAALELILALRDLAAERVEVDDLDPLLGPRRQQGASL